MNKTILTSSELNELKNEIYRNAVAHGFHDEQHTVEHCLGLVLSEIGEAINADRNPDAPVPTQKTIDEARELADDPDEQHVAFIAYFKEHFKGSVVEELADVAIRLLDLAGELGIKFEDDVAFGDLFFSYTFPDNLFTFAMSLDSLDFEYTDQYHFIYCLEKISSIAIHFTHLNLWQVVRLKMLYNDMRPWLNGKKY